MRREVDDEAAVADGVAGDVVAAAADRHEQLVLAGEGDRGDDVGAPGAAGDQGRAAIDHGIEDLAGGVVVRVAGAQQLAAQARPERLDRLLFE